MQRFGSRVHRIPFPGCRHLPFDSDEYWECSIRQVRSIFFILNAIWAIQKYWMCFFSIFHVKSSLRLQFIIRPAHVKWALATTMALLLILDYVCMVRIYLLCNFIFVYVHKNISKWFFFYSFFFQTGVTGLRVIDASISKYNQLHYVTLHFMHKIHIYLWQPEILMFQFIFIHCLFTVPNIISGNPNAPVTIRIYYFENNFIFLLFV